MMSNFFRSNNQPVTSFPAPRQEQTKGPAPSSVLTGNKNAQLLEGPNISDLSSNSNVAYYVPTISSDGSTYLFKIDYDTAFNYVELENYLFRPFSDRWAVVASDCGNCVVFYLPLGQGGKGGKKPPKATPPPAPKRQQPKKDASMGSKNLMRDVNRAAAVAALTPYAGPLASPITDLGERAGSSLIKWLRGSGDYTPSPEPVVNSLIKPNGNAAFKESGTQLQLNESRGSTTVCRREKMATITANGTGAFTNSIFALDPSDYGTWPKLAAEAENYEEARFRGIVVELKSMATGYAATTSLGEHGVGCQYNSLAVPFQDMNSLQMSSTSVTTNSASGVLFGVECAEMARPYNRLYINNSTVPNNATNSLLRSMGNLEICTQYPSAVASGTIMAEVWIHYTVDLYNEINPRPRMGYYHTVATNCTAAAPLGTAGTPAGSGINYTSSYGNLDVGDTVPSLYITGNTIFFPKARLGDYYVIDMFYIMGSSNLSGGSIVVAPSGFAFDPISPFLGSGVYSTGTVTGTVTVNATLYLVFNGTMRCTVPAGNGLIPSLTVTGTGQIPNSADIFVYSLGNGFVFGNRAVGGL